MTVLPKPSMITRKPDSAPLVDGEKCPCNEEKIMVYPNAPPYPGKMSTGALFCVALVAFVVAVTGVGCGLMLYRHYLSSNTISRYQGFCTIPIPNDAKEIEARAGRLNKKNRNEADFSREQRVMPLSWSPTLEPYKFLAADEGQDVVRNLLSEEFDIDDKVERIKVNENGRTISFIHDFSENATGIMDIDRCFLMPLDLDSVMTPDILLIGITSQGSFDISRVTSKMSAIIPAVEIQGRFRDLYEKMHECLDKPVYQLEKDQSSGIRKRSADAPRHDYIQFAGKHVQEIVINNLPEVLQYEKQMLVA